MFVKRGTALIAAVSALVLVAAACGGGNSGSKSAPPNGNVLIAGLTSEPDSLDPGTGLGGVDFAVLYSLYDRLFNLNSKTGAVEPALATAGKFTTPDNLTFELALRKDIKFQDNTPMDAQAVVASLEHYRNAKIQQDLAPVSTVTATGPNTVQITLKSPYPALPAVLADRAGMIVSPNAEKQNNNDLKRHPVGTGPFQFDSWTAGDNIKLTRFPGYWQSGQPKLNGITYKIFSDTTPELNALTTGQINYAFNITASDLPVVKKASNLTVQIEPSVSFDMLLLNTSQAPLNNQLVRQAINMSIDRDAINKARLGGIGTPAYLPLPSTYWAYTSSLKSSFPAYSTSKAQQLLTQAGFPNGVTIQICTSPDRSQIVTLEQAEMAPAGIKVVPVETTSSDCVNRFLTAHSTMAFATGWTGRPDPYLTYSNLLSKTGSYNAGKTAYQGIDDVLAQIANTPDQGKQKPLYDQLNKLFLEDVPLIPIFNSPNLTAYTNNVSGEVPNPLGRSNLTTLYFK